MSSYGGLILGVNRTNFGELDYTSRGAETVSRIYRGVGNSEVREMIQQFFPEMCTLSLSPSPPVSSQF
jgi:hypothetical protein